MTAAQVPHTFIQSSMSCMSRDLFLFSRFISETERQFINHSRPTSLGDIMTHAVVQMQGKRQDVH